jgi:XapX domain-containing protein
MKPYLVSLALGLLVGVIYALFNVRSPAPPVIALAGLLGMLAGEQIPSLVRHVLAVEKTASWVVDDPVEPRMPCQTPPCKQIEGEARHG